MERISLVVGLLLLVGCSTDKVDEEQANLSFASSDSDVVSYSTQFSAPRTVEPGKVDESWMSNCYGDWHHGSNVTYLSWHIQSNNIVRFMWDRAIVDNSSTYEVPCHEQTSEYTMEEETHTYIPIDEGSFQVIIGNQIHITPRSSEAVDDYNLIEKCGYNDWELNVRKRCIDKVWTSLYEGKEYQTGDTLYCSYNLDTDTEEDTLYINCSKNNYPDNVSDVIGLRYLND